MSKLKDLLDREMEEEAEPPIPATEDGSSSPKKNAERKGQKEEIPVWPEKDTTSKVLATISDESFANKVAGTFDHPVLNPKQSHISTGQVKPLVSKNSLKNEGFENSSNDFVLESRELNEKLTVPLETEGSKSINEPPYCSEAGSIKTTEKSLFSPDLEYSKFGGAKCGMESIEKPSVFLAQEKSMIIENRTCIEDLSKSLESTVHRLKELFDRENEEEAQAPSAETATGSSHAKELAEKDTTPKVFAAISEDSIVPAEADTFDLPVVNLKSCSFTGTGSSYAKEPAEKQAQKEEIPISPKKGTRSKDFSVISEDFLVSEGIETFELPVERCIFILVNQRSSLTGQVEPQVPKISLETEVKTSSEEAEGSKCIDEPPYCSDAESFKTTDKYSSSPDLECSKLGDAHCSLESTEKPSGFLGQERSKSIGESISDEEVSKSLEFFSASAPEITVNVKQPEKAKKMVKLASVGVNLESLLDFNLSTSPVVRSNVSGHLGSAESSTMMEEAWEKLKNSYVFFKDKAVGTLAAMDPSPDALNYNQVFVRDFVPSGLACLLKNPSEPEIVKNFLLQTLHLQGWEKRIDDFTLGEGVMPASFKVLKCPYRHKDVLIPDFGGSAIGRVAPVDSGFWWIIMLRSYTKSTRDYALVELPEVQRGMRLILNLCLSDGFDTFPTLLCADGCSMIDRRMGIYGYPIEIQALFYFALRCAKQMLNPERDEGKRLLERIDKRIRALRYHIQKYYWLDFTQLNNIYRYKTEEYSHTAVNKFNVIPESIPDWVFDFMPLRGGYLIGNVSPARMDFRWFLVGNCIAILSSLVTSAQAIAIMDLVEERWDDLIGEMPLKITYPAIEGHEWRLVTGYDPKNTRWSYHNGGSWPVLLWLLASACIKVGRPQMAKRAVELVEQRLSKDGWPEYYDGKTGRYVGKQARKNQTWSISGYLVAKLMIENPSNLSIIALEEDKNAAKSTLTRSVTI